MGVGKRWARILRLVPDFFFPDFTTKTGIRFTTERLVFPLEQGEHEAAVFSSNWRVWRPRVCCFSGTRGTDASFWALDIARMGDRGEEKTVSRLGSRPPAPGARLLRGRPRADPFRWARPDTRVTPLPQTEPLSLEWSVGFTPDVAGSLVNLTRGDGRRVFYTAGHTGVIYEASSGKQTFLRGHLNAITAVCGSADKRFLMTADSGPDNVLVVWDAATGAAVRSIEQPLSGGIVDADFSPDGKYIAALAQDRGAQTMAIWEWNSGGEPVALVRVAAGFGFQHCVRFNPSEPTELVTNGSKRVVFWTWMKDANSLAPTLPRKGVSSVKRNAGALTQTAFVPYSRKAFTATANGNMVQWGIPVDNLSQTSQREAIKCVRVSKSALTSVQALGKNVVTGGDDGAVRFFDQDLRVVAWFEDVKGGAISSVSFGAAPGAEPASAGDFVCPDFIVSTARGKVVELQAALCKRIKSDQRRGDAITSGFEGPVACLAAHPTNPDVFATATTTGMLQLWSISGRRALYAERFGSDKSGTAAISSIAFHPDGRRLLVAAGVGCVKIVVLEKKAEEAKGQSPLWTGTVERELTELRQRVTSIAVSPCGNYIATGDLGRHVALYRWYHRDESTDKPVEWIYVGRSRSHTKPIVDVAFLPPNWGAKDGAPIGTIGGSRLDADATPRLFSLGEDRALVEYDVLKSSLRKGLRTKNRMKVDRAATPTAFLARGGGSPRLCCATDAYQIKLLDRKQAPRRADRKSSSPKRAARTTDRRSGDRYQCVRTTVSPTYGGPISALAVIPRVGSDGKSIQDSSYAYYSTYSKVVGLMKLPLDGNPVKTSALVAHAGEISGVACSCDGSYLVTAGGDDRSLSVWRVSYRAMDAAVVLGGDAKTAYANMVRAGRGPAAFDELKQYFVLCQLKDQGLDTTEARRVTGLISREQVINLFRAMGFLPTQDDIRNVYTEIDRDESLPRSKDGQPLVDFDTVVRLYANHRPVVGLLKEDMEAALATLSGGGEAKELAIDRDELLQKLQSSGDAMTAEEIAACLRSLQGESDSTAAAKLVARLPAKMNAQQVAEDLLGFESTGA